LVACSPSWKARKISSIVYTEKFERDVKKLKDSLVRERIAKQVEKLVENPESGKPLRYGLKGEWTIRVKPYPIIYAVQDDRLILLRFEHLKKSTNKHAFDRSPNVSGKTTLLFLPE
jgi:addiction module RelE/StbE family toxin